MVHYFYQQFNLNDFDYYVLMQLYFIVPLKSSIETQKKSIWAYVALWWNDNVVYYLN